MGRLKIRIDADSAVTVLEDKLCIGLSDIGFY